MMGNELRFVFPSSSEPFFSLPYGSAHICLFGLMCRSIDKQTAPSPFSLETRRT
jgi:hypothetical protein